MKRCFGNRLQSFNQSIENGYISLGILTYLVECFSQQAVKGRTARDNKQLSVLEPMRARDIASGKSDEDCCQVVQTHHRSRRIVHTGRQRF